MKECARKNERRNKNKTRKLSDGQRADIIREMERDAEGNVRRQKAGRRAGE